MKNLYAVKVQNGVFVPRGIISPYDLVYDENLRLVRESELTRGKENCKNVSNAPPILEILPEHNRSSKSLVFLGRFEEWHYGAWLTEGLARFWYLFDVRVSDVLVPASRTFGARMRRYKNEFLKGRVMHWKHALKAFAISRKQLIYFHRPTQIKEIIVPQCSMHNCGVIFPQHREVTRAIALHVLGKNQPAQDMRPVYLSRTRLRGGGRSTQGEMPIETFCLQNGFRVIHPESMTLSDQIELFNSHDAFVGFAGSAFHSLLFRNNNRPAICLYLYDGRNHTNLDLIDALMGNYSQYVPCCHNSDGKKTYEIDSAVAIDAIGAWQRSLQNKTANRVEGLSSNNPVHLVNPVQ